MGNEEMTWRQTRRMTLGIRRPTRPGHCRPISPAIAARVTIALFVGCFCPTAPAQEEAVGDIPELTIESLYHPTDQFEHLTDSPRYVWLATGENQSAAVLIEKTKEGWRLVDQSNGDRQDWKFARILQDALQPFHPAESPTTKGESDDGESGEGKAEKNRRSKWIDPIIGSIKSLATPMIAKIDKSLVWINVPQIYCAADDRSLLKQDDTSQTIKVITQDASNFDDATLDPTGRRVAYTLDGDLYVYELDADSTRRLTDDASKDRLNGRLDWIYQEEIFGRNNYKGFWFSPDGNHLAALRIDNTNVAKYSLGNSALASGVDAATPYPLPGQKIPVAWLTVFDLQSGSQTDLLDPIKSAADQTIITGVWWNTISGDLLYCLSDRRQQRRDLMRWKPTADDAPTMLLREQSAYWIEPPKTPVPLTQAKFYWYSQVDSGRGRVYTIDTDAQTKTAVTPADFHVREMILVKQKLLVLGSEDPTEQHVFEAVPAIDGEVPSTTTLLPITSQPGWHEPQFQSTQSGVVNHPDELGIWLDSYSSIDQPAVVDLRRERFGQNKNDGPDQRGEHPVRLHQVKLKLRRPLLPSEKVSIVVDGDISLTGWLTKPTISTGQKLGVVIEVYGGPQTSVATNRWHGRKRLCRDFRAKNGIATLVVDNRSSISGGVIGSWPVSQRFGEIESSDTIAVADWLSKRSWVDASRIAITGWSFGGYLVARVMTRSDKFAAGVAGGSVTDWHQYDAFYTERYMGFPDHNKSGYESSSILNEADQLHGRLLLIHGEMDDNVHPRGTFDLVHSLQKAGKSFDLMIYPGEKHSVRKRAAKFHLEVLTESFLHKNVSGSSRDDR